METFRNYPYRWAVLGAATLVFVGGLVVRGRLPSEAAPSASPSWGDGGLVAPGISMTSTTSNASGTSAETASALANAQNVAILPYKMQPTSTSAKPVSEDNSPFDASALLGILSPAETGRQTAGSDTGIDPWSYVPATLVSTSSKKQSLTPDQKALYDYGNAAGAIIKSYDATHANQASFLNASVLDRQNAQKAAAVSKIGSDLEAVGARLQALAPPSLASSANAALAASYEAAGMKLEAVASATDGADSGFLDAIRSYDAAADGLSANFANTALLFSANGVSFSSSDAGSAFSFSASGL